MDTQRKQTVSFTIEDEVKAAIHAEASRRGISASRLVNDLCKKKFCKNVNS